MAQVYKSEIKEYYERFRQNPSPLHFSPALDSMREERDSILKLVKQGESLPHLSWPYMGEVDHPRLGRLLWNIVELPGGDMRDIRLGMYVKGIDDPWYPPAFTAS